MGVKYIPRDGQLMATPPMTMSMTLYVFALEAEYARLQAVCDRYLNIGGPVEYRALLPLTILYCSAEEPRPVNNPIGWCPEKDFGFWVPVVAGHRENGKFVADKIQVFTPYLWVDSGIPLIGGREVFGFPKQLATLTMPATTKDRAVFTVDTLVIPTFGPNSECVQKRLFDLAPLGANPATIEQQLARLGATAELLADVAKLVEQVVDEALDLPLPTPELIVSMLKLFSGSLPMVFLKQFADVGVTPPGEEPDACYQAIVENSIDVTSGLTWSILLGDYEIDLFRYDSHQIAEQLGLGPAVPSGESNRLRSLLQGWVQFDSRIEGGRVVYRSV